MISSTRLLVSACLALGLTAHAAPVDTPSEPADKVAPNTPYSKFGIHAPLAQLLNGVLEILPLGDSTAYARDFNNDDVLDDLLGKNTLGSLIPRQINVGPSASDILDALFGSSPISFDSTASARDISFNFNNDDVLDDLLGKDTLGL
ncbi:unnamed protein product [Peniophora sp. CBMAI 1063]|nr:unnamed protein product [Peniophora sp. CBMAI 1063]